MESLTSGWGHRRTQADPDVSPLDFDLFLAHASFTQMWFTFPELTLSLVP